MADMRRDQEADRDAKKGKGKKGIESYSGGERSGMAVLQPGQGQENPDSSGAADAFAAARAAGAVTGGSLPHGSAQITLYADGFTVNGGPLRSLADPKNKKFVDDIQAGNAPEELQAADGTPVHIAVIDKRPAQYEAPGAAAMTGSSGSSSYKPIQPGQADLSQGATAGPTATGAGSVTVDPSKPVTSIMIRFGDGRRQTQEFNEDALVSDLYKFVEDCTGVSEFKLTEGFPPKPIIDKVATLKAAGLLKASINVKS
eukprot:CAMPEP_0178999598 /NCGR_PEP_ID=MMETSP0795-20121207/10157_1 /TAXON_ID=88552 /ORGANISM="Amoebophrya sp., Strain Ameob2" /LENGTH=256 /DNA_ID=CAMNT_0020692405 /DNA_START=133 /DNA_END=903 /DNA_ORIENTATION=+